MLCQQESLLSHEDPLESAIIDLHVHISRQRHGRTADLHRKGKSTDTLTPESRFVHSPFSKVRSSIQVWRLAVGLHFPRDRPAGCLDKPQMLTCVSTLGFTVNAPDLKLTNIRAVTRPPLRRRSNLLSHYFAGRIERTERTSNKIRTIGLSFHLKLHIPQTHGSSV